MLSLCFAVPNEDTNLTAVDLSSSIHAPLAGCDNQQNRDVDQLRSFQSTHPLRGATFNYGLLCLEPQQFQSTHPLRGATNPMG